MDVKASCFIHGDFEASYECPKCAADQAKQYAKLYDENARLRKELAEAKAAYGKLFNENAALLGRLEETEDDDT